MLITAKYAGIIRPNDLFIYNRISNGDIIYFHIWWNYKKNILLYFYIERIVLLKYLRKFSYKYRSENNYVKRLSIDNAAKSFNI